MTLTTELNKALKILKPDARDAATVALARRYAKELDDAAKISKQLVKPLRDLLELDPDLHDRFLSLATRIEETAVAATIGPKMLAALEQLQMTPRARVQLMKGNSNVGSPSPNSPLDELRAKRDNRVYGA
jgi:hypothetical protein